MSVAVPPLVLATWSITHTGEQAKSVKLERRGVDYLQPLTRLLGSLVTAQSVAVRGASVDMAMVQGDLAAVGRANDKHGSTLHTQSRWLVLREVIAELGRRPGGRGIEAYQRWSEAVDLTVALATTIGDTAELVLDPNLDSRYLIDVGLVRLPEVIRCTGQLADLLVLGAARQSIDETRAAIVRDRIATNSAAISMDLGKVVDATGSGRVSSALLAPLDQFGSAVDALAPSISVALMPPLPTDVSAAAVAVHNAATRLAATVWSEVDVLVAGRESDLSTSRVAVTLIAVLAVCVAGAFAALTGRRRPEPSAGPSGDGPAEPPTRGAEPPPRGTGRSPVSSEHGDPAIGAILGVPRTPAGAR